MNILAIDPGTQGTGLAFTKLGSPEFKSETIEARKGIIGKEKLKCMAKDIMDIVNREKRDFIAIEDYGFGGKFFNIEVAELVGMLLWNLRDVKIVFVAPNTVKKLVTGSGKATKSGMKKEIKNRYTEEGNTTVHEFDAVGILEILESFLNGTMPDETRLKLVSRMVKL